MVHFSQESLMEDKPIMFIAISGNISPTRGRKL